VHGDVAWGGNWFFLCADHGLDLSAPNVALLTAQSEAIRQALVAAGITGADGAEVDHIELMGPPHDAQHHGRNFVLCPGLAYDRSPCGTGTSARLACLAADGRLAEGAELVQESIVGSSFRGSFRWVDRERGIIVPTITGTAHVTAEATLLLDERDPFCWGIR
jgi:proline racemase